MELKNSVYGRDMWNCGECKFHDDLLGTCCCRHSINCGKLRSDKEWCGCFKHFDEKYDLREHWKKQRLANQEETTKETIVRLIGEVSDEEQAIRRLSDPFDDSADYYDICV